MIVVDASIVIEVLLNTEAGDRIADRLLDSETTIAAPQLLDVEVVQVLRRYDRSKELSESRGAEAIDDLHALPIQRYPHGELMERAWALRDWLTAYDAVYVALAEALDAVLLTRDKRLAASTGHDATIDVV